MLVRRLFLYAFMALAASASHHVEATLIQWTLSDVAFNDGGTASGSFLYDADIQSVTGYDVTTTAGTALPGDQYVDLFGTQPPYPAASFAIIDIQNPADFTGSPFLAFSFASPLSNAGGTIPLRHTISEGFCSNATCSFGNYRRSIADGVVIGNPIPEPGTIALVAAALAGFGIRRAFGRGATG